jgi:hypothetical protein
MSCCLSMAVWDRDRDSIRLPIAISQITPAATFSSKGSSGRLGGSTIARTMNLTRSRLPDLTEGNSPIKLIGFHSGDALAIDLTKLTFHPGNGFLFLDLPLAPIVDQSAAYPAFVRRIAASKGDRLGFFLGGLAQAILDIGERVGKLNVH